MKTSYYQVIHYNQRPDGRIEPAGTERLVLSREEALELSYSAIVVSMGEGIRGSRTFIHEGKHSQFDGHLGWLS
jgi:hypothetical protein